MHNFLSIPLLYFKGPWNESCTLSNVYVRKLARLMVDLTIWMTSLTNRDGSHGLTTIRCTQIVSCITLFSVVLGTLLGSCHAFISNIT